MLERVAGSGLEVRVIRGDDELASLAPAWRALHEADSGDVFNSWDWLAPWWRHLRQSSNGQSQQLFVMLATDRDGTVRGLMPLSLATVRLGLQRVRRLGFIGDSQVGSDYLDLLAEPGWRGAVIEAFAASLVRHAESWDIIELLDMDETSSSAGQLLDAMGPRYTGQMDKRLLCPGQD
ncbi:MAG: hypothetical protein ACNA7J_10025, partial [Wenzhouxiangella sp.]